MKADFLASAKILVASGIAAVATYLCLGVFSVAPLIKLVVGCLLFLVVYLASAPLIGAINQTDVDNLRAMFSGLGIVSKALEIPLRFVEFPLAVRNRKNPPPPTPPSANTS